MRQVTKINTCKYMEAKRIVKNHFSLTIFYLVFQRDTVISTYLFIYGYCYNGYTALT